MKKHIMWIGLTALVLCVGMISMIQYRDFLLGSTSTVERVDRIQIAHLALGTLSNFTIVFVAMFIALYLKIRKLQMQLKDLHHDLELIEADKVRENKGIAPSKAREGG